MAAVLKPMHTSRLALITILVIVAGCVSFQEHHVDSCCRPILAAGSKHSLFLDRDGVLWAWGSNEFGQLGDGTNDRAYVPEKVGSGYSAIAAGNLFSLALKPEGSLWTWGANLDGSFTRTPRRAGTGYRDIAAACYHAVAIRTDGSLWGWGLNDHGVLGDGTQTESPTPKQIGTGFSAVAAGCFHNLALKPDGSLWAWGWNEDGVVGDGTTTDVAYPKHIADGFLAVFASRYTSFAIKADGSLWMWGKNRYGQLSQGMVASSTVPVKLGEGFVKVVDGGSQIAALKDDGSLWRWEGLGPAIKVGRGFTALSAGDDHILAAKKDGSVLAWGDDLEGQLGDNGATRASPLPREVKFGVTADPCPQGPFETTPPAATRAESPSTALPLIADEPFTYRVLEIERIRNGGVGHSGGGLQAYDEAHDYTWGFDADRGLFVTLSHYRYGLRGRFAPPPEPLNPQAQQVIRQGDNEEETITAVPASPPQVRRFACLANRLLATPPTDEPPDTYTDEFYKNFCLMKAGQCLNEAGGSRRWYLEDRMSDLITQAMNPRTTN